MNEPWWSYNPIAERYARVAEELYFSAPARDLLSLLHLEPGCRFLDVGTGTGVVAGLAAGQGQVGPTPLVVGVDRAVGMLARCRTRRGVTVVAGELPALPLLPARFDAVAAAFVLTHVPDDAGALRAMIDVLRPGGRLAISAWARSPSGTPPGEAWQAVVREFVDEADLRAALGTVLPWEAAFADPVHVERVLSGAGLTDIVVRQVWYPIETTTRAYVESRLLSLSSRFMEAALPPDDWSRFTAEVTRRLDEAFGARLEFEVGVNLGAGTRTSAC